MQPVSQEFKNAIAADSRHIVGKVQIDFTDPFLDQSIDVSVNEQAAVSFPAQVADAIQSPTQKYASLDGSWVLDGSWGLAPDTPEQGQLGWWGHQLANVSGNFTTPYPKLTVNFFSRPIRSLKVVGDDKRGEYPVEFSVKLFGPGDFPLHIENVAGNTEITWTKAITPVAGVVKMTLEIFKWSHPGRQVKILEFFTSIQEVYEGDDIISISLVEEREVSQGSLPIGNISANEIDIKLNNITNRFNAGNALSPLYGLLKANRRIRPYIGIQLPDQTIEYIPLGVFWSGDWETPEQDIYAHTTGRDRMEMLRKSTYSTSQVYIDVTLYDLAVYVLQDAGLTEEKYWVDPELQNYSIAYAWLDQQSHREALRKIGEACLGQVYCNREGIVRVEGPNYVAGQAVSLRTFLQAQFPAQMDETIDAYGIGKDDYFKKDNPVRWSEIANYIEVSTNPLRPVAVPEEIYRSNEPVFMGSGQQKAMTVFYNATPCIDAIASLEGAVNTVISSASYYAWGANVILNNPGAVEEITVIINGKPLKVLNKEKAVAQDFDSITDNGRLRYALEDNPLIQSLDIAQTIADKILASFKDPRRDVEIDWRGDPSLELADIVVVPDYQRDGQDNRGYFYITSQTLDFDGGLSAATKGRRI